MTCTLPAERGSKPIPATTRRAVNHRAQGCCENCGARTTLALHHLHYDTVGEERPDDLRALCRECHLGEHIDINGVFWADPVERYYHWETYDRLAFSG